MRLGLNLLLIALIAGLVYILANSIKEPIQFQNEHQRRKDAVVDKLMKIRTAQECYRGITGKFAHNFDTLNQVLQTGKFSVVQVFGDPDDPNNKDAIRYDTTFLPAIDSINTLGINLDSLRYVPFGSGAVFNIDADTMTYQKTLVNVVEVGVVKNKFMGPYADERFKKYDNSYDPNAIIKFGNMNAPNTSGNWER